MERLTDHGYIPMDHRELRLSFKQPRDITDPDLAAASGQISRGDRQMLNEAKKLESENRRVWFFVTFPCDSSSSKSGKSVVKVDLLIATPYGAMVVKVLDWSGPCITSPGEKWVETKSDGSKVEHPNQLAEVDLTTQWVRLFFETKNICPSLITSYVLFTSPHVKPSFTSDPRIIVGPSACSALVCGNGLTNELAQSKSYMEWGQNALKAVANKVRKSDVQQTSNQVPDDQQFWRHFQLSMDSIPQFDLLYLRKNSCFIFGHLEGFLDRDATKSNTTKTLERFCNRTTAKLFRFEHSMGGLAGVPLALLTGGLGWEPTCRIRHVQANTAGATLGSIDISPEIRLVFRPYGCEGLVSAEANDVDILELARVPRSMTVAEDGSDTGVVDQLGSMIGGMLTKSIQAGVKNMLPFPLNTIVS